MIMDQAAIFPVCKCTRGSWYGGYSWTVRVEYFQLANSMLYHPQTDHWSREQ